MRATDFEIRHPTLLHYTLVGAALGTYLFESDDVVWRFIKSSPSHALLEHVSFAVAAAFIALGAALSTRSRAFSRNGRNAGKWGHAGEALYVIGLASLLPLPGAVMLIAGESLRVIRLWSREQAEASTNALSGSRSSPEWSRAFRLDMAKWGVFLTMIAFSITLVDRVADILVVASVVAWMIVNAPSYCRAQKTS